MSRTREDARGCAIEIGFIIGFILGFFVGTLMTAVIGIL